MDPEAYQQARVAAVVSRKKLGVWLAEAIREKIAREGGTDVSKANR